MRFNYEYEKKLRVGYIGAGEHSFRNILPSLQYAPIELVALADHHPERGLAIARQFGARRFYPNHQALLNKEKDQLDAVMIAIGRDAEGRPRYPQVAGEALRAGFHTWVEQPPCFSADEVMGFTSACMAHHKYIVTGFEKMFVPAYLKVLQIIEDPAFGGVSSFSLRYPLIMPAEDKRKDPLAMSSFLDFVRPYSLLVRLFGESQGFSFVRSNVSGGAVFNFRFPKDVVGSLHLTGGQAGTSPLERLEVVGNGANVVVENGTRLIYYRPGGARGQGEYGHVDSFIGPDEAAPICWEPEFSLGQLYNKQIFLQGYVGCISYFAEQLLADEPPRHGNLMHMLHIMNVFDKIKSSYENHWTSI
jgi:predicted dehydrogenase